MRAGSVFRRCTKTGCRSRASGGARACPKCGGDSFSWSFMIDLALPGSPRHVLPQNLVDARLRAAPLLAE